MQRDIRVQRFKSGKVLAWEERSDAFPGHAGPRYKPVGSFVELLDLRLVATGIDFIGEELGPKRPFCNRMLTKSIFC